MNSIRWMPMIRWLKFPFRVHILHKTVQLSVHELWGGYVCMWLKACPTVPPSNSEQGWKPFFNIFLCFCISFLWPMSKLLFRSALFCAPIKPFVQRWNLTFGSCFGKYFVCNSEWLHFGFLIMILIISLPYKTGNHNTLSWNSGEIPTRHIICMPCQWCNIMPHCERVSNFSLCESESEQGSYSLPDNCQNNSR